MMEYELYHHGVKGMKWGVRRYQNKDGSLTPAGVRRYDKEGSGSSKIATKQKKGYHYSLGNPIQKHKQKLIDKYISKGYSLSAAQTMAKQRMRAEVAVGVVGGIAVGIAAKKAITRIGQDYCDKTIKSGEIIQNIGASKGATFENTPFFAAINRHDKRAYGALYPVEKRGMVIDNNSKSYEGIYKNQIKLVKNIKRASVNNARKILYKKMDDDPEFRKEVLDTIKQTSYGANIDLSSKHLPKKFYDRFNQALATPEFQSKGIHKKFYSELQKHGYNALLDINDTRYSGYKKISKSPTIVFGENVVEKIGSEKLGYLKMLDDRSKYLTEHLLKNAGKKTVTAVAGYAAIKTLSDERKVRTYLNEHPDSKLSRNEILKLLKQK